MEEKRNVWLLVTLGAVSGALNGFFGGGGGTIIVPLLISACGFLRKNAHATALLVMLPVSIASAIVYAVNGKMDFLLALPVTIGFSLGGAVGALLLNKLNAAWLKYAFCIIMLAAGVRLIIV